MAAKPGVLAGAGRRDAGPQPPQPAGARFEVAFQLKDYSLSAPAWLDSARFDIAAKIPEGAAHERFPEMVQNLLIDRFKLAYHRESKVMPALVLVVDKKGLKVKPVADRGQHGSSTSYGRLTANQLTMARLAEVLSRELDRPVEDRTGVSGLYDITLRFVPDNARPTARPEDPSASSSIFAALQEQAGLRLETRKLPVEILVVDHIERRPTEN